VYQAVPGFEDHLIRELGPGIESRGPLFFVPGSDEPTVSDDNAGPAGGSVRPAPFWHQNAWLNPVKIEFDSVNEAAAALRRIQRNWCFSPCGGQFRRGALIESRLPAVYRKPRPFPWLLPDSPMGAWTLLDAHTMIAASECSSPFPGGVIEFEEDKLGPPSRAYLKLWEALVRLRRWPGPGERCLDAGASPGGWTWALARLGAEVIAVDRAPLDPKLAAMQGAAEGTTSTPALRFIKHDAFTLKPEDIGPLDWLFCDVICYPRRLYEWIEKWLASGLCKNFVCTIKMQGKAGAAAPASAPAAASAPASAAAGPEAGSPGGTDFDTPRRFAAIPGSQVVHLYHNKHELTWLLLHGS
jgi:23S rRNA (cytidine2498-2'-O)-methyltransferase